MPDLSRRNLTTVAAVVAAALGGTAIADAASSSSSTTSTTAATTATAPFAGAKQRPAPERALTGDTAEKVKAAALAEVPGTVIRVEEDRGGAYEAHIRKADGTAVEVHVGKDFKVTGVGVRTGHGPGGDHGRGGPGGHADLTAIAKTLGVTEAKLQSAVDAARPATTGDRAAKGDRATDLAKELGVTTAAVRKVLDANRPAGGLRGGMPGAQRGDQAALITALAKGLSLPEATVKAAVGKLDAAHQADHAANETAMYAAIAKSLGTSTADVKAAFDAARPATTTAP